MLFAIKAAFLCTGFTLLLQTPLTASQEPCILPTDQDVKDVADIIFASLASEGAMAQSVQELFQVHFTCLARVAQDMYAYATVVANFTTDISGSQVQQFQLRCVDDEWVRSVSTRFKDSADISAMPFAIETQFQCSQCEQMLASTPNYDDDSHCLCECKCWE